MWNCVPCEVLRQCSATNPSDIIKDVPSMTVLGLRKIPENYTLNKVSSQLYKK